MHVSIDKDSPHYDPECHRCVPIIDGVEEKHCIEANTDEGWLVRYVTEDCKEVRRMGRFITEKVYGKVELFIDKPVPGWGPPIMRVPYVQESS